MTESRELRIIVSLLETEARALVEFLKRTTFDDYLRKTVNTDQEQAYFMQAASGKIRDALSVAAVSSR